MLQGEMEGVQRGGEERLQPGGRVGSSRAWMSQGARLRLDPELSGTHFPGGKDLGNFHLFSQMRDTCSLSPAHKASFLLDLDLQPEEGVAVMITVERQSEDCPLAWDAAPRVQCGWGEWMWMRKKMW